MNSFFASREIMTASRDVEGAVLQVQLICQCLCLEAGCDRGVEPLFCWIG